MNKIAFIILSYNGLAMTRDCIDSIRQNCTDVDYEIVIVDNASTDGSVEWLQQQGDIKLLANQENAGFPKGCNQGIAMAEPESDIFLLNNDTLVPPRSVRLLQEALYSSERIAAVGPVSNRCTNNQEVCEESAGPENYMEIAAKYTEGPCAWEQKTWLMGFAMLIKRSVLSWVGVLDEQFFPGNFEDNDIGWRIKKAGYDLLLCHNSFIFHYGSSSFGKNREKYINILIQNRLRFEKKWGTHPFHYSWLKPELVEMLQQDQKAGKFCLLEAGCGTGSTLARIQYLYPEAQLYGTEQNPTAAELANTMFPVLTADMEECKLPEDWPEFDYILIGGVLEFVQHPAEALRFLGTRLTERGKIIGSIHCPESTEDSKNRELRTWYPKDAVLLLLQMAGYGEGDLLCTRDGDGQVNQYVFSFRKPKAVPQEADWKSRAWETAERFAAELLDSGQEKRALVLAYLWNEFEDLAEYHLLMSRIYEKNHMEDAAYSESLEAVRYGEQAGTNMEKRISVVVPCYNAAEYIRDCLEHLVNQTIGIEHMEIILVDDASTDDGATLSVLLEYEQRYPENIMVIPLEENLHQGGARNVGIFYASGEYLAFCDADDWFADNALEQLYHTAKKYDCDVVEFEHYEVYQRNGADKKISKDFGEDHMWRINSPENRKAYITAEETKSTLGCWNKLYRRALITGHEIRFAEHVFWEEPSFTQIVRFYTRKHYFLHMPLYYYYIHEQSTMRSSYNKLHQLQTYEVILEDLRRRGLDKEYPLETEFIFWQGYFHYGSIFAAAAGTYFTKEQFVRMQKRAAEVAPDIKQNPYFRNRFGRLPQVADLTYCDVSGTDISEIYKIYRSIYCLTYGIPE